MASISKEVEILKFYALCIWLDEDASAEMYSLNELHDNYIHCRML